MLSSLPVLPADPLLGLSIAYQQDPREEKVDLGVGVYKNAQGETPIMSAVAQAQSLWAQREQSKAYTPPAGIEGFNQGMMNLLLGENNPAIIDQRVISVQTPGGCGALRVAAGMLVRCQEKLRIWVSAPTWANHIPLLTSAGIELHEYPYYNYDAHGINFDAMMETLQYAKAGDVVLLHGCCHNPSGADLSYGQWQALTRLLLEKNLIPFVDIAYQGLGDGLDEDVQGLRYLVEHCPEVVVASSCSKNFGLYRERVGAVVVVASNITTANTCRNQLLNVAREIYSMPPSHGAAIVDLILSDQGLTHLWQQELNEMRHRITTLRQQFSTNLTQKGFADHFDFIQNEKGMFSFLGINQNQVQQLRDDKGIYMAASSRINVAGLSDNNMDYVVDALSKVIV